ncbi:MAG: PAS domain-containing sensor histidine kinase [Chloroflexi bacterium]|nr:MAG: PAS domain-containing sensor histidine kinase [Chloroflexota bacterium]
MMSRMRWRIILPYAVLVILMMGGLYFNLSQPSCYRHTTCIRTAVFITASLLILASTVMGLIISSRLEKQLNHLSDLSKRLIAGNRHAPLPRHEQGEIGVFARTFSQLVDHDNDLILKLQEERDQLSKVLVYMADGVIIADPLGHVRQINPAACRLLGTTADKAVKHMLAEVLRHHELIGLWQRCQQENEEQFAAIEVEQNLFLQAVMTPYQHKDFQAYLVILQDLTTIRRLETVRRDFISNISHELRTPLASLRAVVETLQVSALEDPPAARRFLSRAEHEVDTIMQMVEELLELSRIESGRVPIRLSPTAVTDLIEIPVERFKAQADRDHIDLILNLPSDLPFVLADADRMQQVINNLVHNALKFTPEGSITISALRSKDTPKSVRKHIRGMPPSVVFSVKDTGSGIPADDLPRIFERFYKSDRARTRGQGGTGLGLAIARHIIHAHHGIIWAESKENKGSTFYFTLRTA